MIVTAAELRDLVYHIFHSAGCGADEAGCIARHLVESNLVGHDSHGVIRVASYVQWLREGKVFADRTASVILESEAIVVLDGGFGFGQSIGEQAMARGIQMAERHGVAVVALRNSGHLGRIGDWAEMSARAGKLSLHWVNTTGAGILVSPFGGIDRRLSANPISAGIPMASGEPMVVDISACTIAEGKIRVALNKGVPVPENTIIDGQGRPTTDPGVFYSEPGAILPIAGHKGYALSMVCEVLAGALTGSGCSNVEHGGRVANGMLSILMDRSFFGEVAAFDAEIERFVAYVKSSRPVAPGGSILMPGEPEAESKRRKLEHGIELDPNTWAQICGAARQVGAQHPLLDRPTEPA